jgi:hypothetical protein
MVVMLVRSQCNASWFRGGSPGHGKIQGRRRGVRGCVETVQLLGQVLMNTNGMSQRVQYDIVPRDRGSSGKVDSE